MIKNLLIYFFLIHLGSIRILAYDEVIFNSIEQNSGGFNASEFYNWLLVAEFNANDVGTFRFINSGNGTNWNLVNANKKEYIYNGEDTKAGIFAILNVSYYQYRAQNPLYSISSDYNNSDFINRFFFYRFTGKGVGVLSLNNYLIAIDKYSKYIFAFAKPTSFKKLFGKSIPTSWGPVDNETINGKRLYFFEYDPAGIVKPDGNIEIYEWFSERLSQEKYSPIYTGKSPYVQ